MSSPLRIGLASATLASIVLGFVQAGTDGFAGHDDYYHVAWSQELARQGIARFPPPFPWLPHTILNPREYVDHHMLYHVLLSAFVRQDGRRGGKVAAVVFASAAIGSFGWLLARWSVRYPLAWVLALLAASHPFLYRLSMVRAQSASLGFLLVAAALAESGARRSLLYLGMLYVWLYDAFPLLLLVVGLDAAARFLVDRERELGGVAFAAAGIGLGLVLHPYFPLNLVFTYRHLAEKVLLGSGVPVGTEWAAYSSRHLLLSSLPAFALAAASILHALLREQRPGRREIFALLLAGAFLLMAALSRRFIEYWPAFAVLSAATLGGERLARMLSARSWPARAAQAGAAGVLFGVLGGTAAGARAAMADGPPFDRYAGAARWLAENTPRGAVVFTSDWDDFPELYYFNRHNRYLAGLDPTYSSLHRPAAYRRWVEMTRGDLEDTEEFFERWEAELVFTDRDHRDFLRALRKLKGAELAYQDRHALVYRLHR